jgi:hypothetical protein
MAMPARERRWASRRVTVTWWGGRPACIGPSPNSSLKTRSRGPWLRMAAGTQSVAISPIATTPSAADSCRPRRIADSRSPFLVISCCRRHATTRSIQAASPPLVRKGSSRAENSRCVWALMRPGVMTASPRSICRKRSAACGRPEPIPVTRPRSHLSQACSIAWLLSGNSQRALRMSERRPSKVEAGEHWPFTVKMPAPVVACLMA